MRALKIVLVVAAPAVLAVALVVSGRVPVQAQARTARQVVDAAVAALGGAEKLRAVSNITLVGYGQYAYQFGGGRITGEPTAPEKYIAANELRRVYDLEHNRFQLVERRSMLFPFLAPFGHSWAPITQVLDGDIAYDVTAGKTVRVAREGDGALQVDGVHARRMLMMTNPVVLVRALMDLATQLSAPRRQGTLNVIDVTLKQGNRVTAAFASTGLPAWIRWAGRQTNVGQMNFTTTFSGWSDATGTSGILLPLAYQTRISYRDVDFFKLYVDAYQVDSAIPDLVAPESVRHRAGAAVVPGSDDHIAGDRQGSLAGQSGRHNHHRVSGSPGVVRARGQCGRCEGRDRSRPHTCAGKAGHASDSEPQSLRSHRRAAPGGSRRAHDCPASRQRTAIPRYGGASGAGLSGRSRTQSETAQVSRGGRASAPVGRHADARPLLGAQQRPHGRRACRLHPVRTADDGRRPRNCCVRMAALARRVPRPD